MNEIDLSKVTNSALSWRRGPNIAPMQRLLQVRPDGVGGPATRAALYAAQMSRALRPDCVFGEVTALAMLSGR